MPEAHFNGGGGSRVRDMARPLLRNFGAKFSERSFYYVFNALFPKRVADKKKSCVYFSNFPYIHSFTCENQIRSQLTCILIFLTLLRKF